MLSLRWTGNNRASAIGMAKKMMAALGSDNLETGLP
jgi:hypothetical protein